MSTPTRKRNTKASKAQTNSKICANSDAENVPEKRGIWASFLQFDEEFTKCCAVCANKESRFSSLRPLMKLVEISNHGIPWLVCSILLLLSVHKASDVEILVNLLYGLVLDLIIIGILKVIFRRSRPLHNEMDMFATLSIDKYSFPSGHASRAGLLFLFFLLHYIESTKWVCLLLVWSLVVTLSRVILGRHHLIDVICGYFVGIVEYLLLIYLWIPTDTCLQWLELYFSHFHL